MAYAVIATGGKQYRVEPGRFFDVEKVAAEEQASFTLDQVLLLVSDTGEVTVGRPLVEGAVVQTTVLQHGKGRKVVIYKMRPKKHYRRKKGHRQPFTRLMVETIECNGIVWGTTVETAPEVVAVDAELVPTS